MVSSATTYLTDTLATTVKRIRIQIFLNGFESDSILIRMKKKGEYFIVLKQNRFYKKRTYLLTAFELT